MAELDQRGSDRVISGGQRIFLSYGHDEHARDALRIKADLEAHGHEVWFDLERLLAGRDWEAYIEDGLRWCNKMVLLMTPHSVRRRDLRDPLSRDGYCLNEIAKALERNGLTIIPVLLVSLEPDGPPTSICRIQYLDLRDAVPISDREAIYQIRLDRLIQAIETNELDFEGGQARLIHLLNPLRFEAEIGRHVAQFCGREWLFDEIQTWLHGRPDSRVFWLTGGPGVGKTAIAARLCHTHRNVLAYHLCVAGHDDKADPKRALLSIAYQISQHLPEYERRLQKLELESETIKNTQTLFDNLIVQPLGAGFPEPDGPRIVLVDAIDEATRNGRNEIAEFIAAYWDDTPGWLRLIITSRPEEREVVASLAHLRPYPLDAQQPNNKKDLGDYFRNELANRKIAVDQDAVDEILNRSGGFFLYVKMVLESLDQGQLSIDRIDEFPIGLGGHYQRFFQRQFPNIDEYNQKMRPILEAVCAQRHALPIPVLKHAVGSPEDLLQRLGKLGSLFPRTPLHTAVDEQVLAPFHKSVRDWLTTSGGNYAIDSSRGESVLANTALSWEAFPQGPAQSYLIRHGVPHMVNSRRFVDACELMHRLLQVSPLPADIAPSEIHDAGLYLCNGFANCPPGEAKALSAEKLIQIAVECCGIDHYAMMPAFRILYYHRQANWPQLRHTVINSNWSAMYAASLVMAEATSSQGVGRALAEITELTSSSDILEQELGLYALKLLKADAKKVMELARRFAGSDVYVVIAVLNELLLTQALDGEDACGFIDDVNMWKAPWPYHRTQLVDIAAVQELLRNSSTPFSAEVEVARAREELAATLRLREELLELPAITADPILGNLLRNYEKLPRKLTDIPLAEGPIRRSAAMDRLLLLLFAHPAWEVRAGASKVAASVAGGRPEVEQLISQWLDHADYRVRYAAVEAAYHLRYRNQAALFEHAVRRRAGDEQSWVRGIVADCLAEWILREGEQDYAERVQRFKSEAVELLNYNDVWPLEAMQLVVRRLREHDIDVMALLGKPIGGLLGQIPQWDTLDRAELEPALDALLRSR